MGGLVFEPRMAGQGKHCRRPCQWEPVVVSKVVPFRDLWEKIPPAFSRTFPHTSDTFHSLLCKFWKSSCLPLCFSCREAPLNLQPLRRIK